MDNRPIGVFDSGLGGLTVVRQLMHQLPEENIVYFGDTGRIPYGTRSPATIEKYARQACRFLLSEDVKMIIAACGTVSSVAPHVLAELPVPAIGVVKPAADAAAKATQSGRVGVIGTAATIRSGAFRKRIVSKCPNAVVAEQACPVFVTLVENGWIDLDDEITHMTAQRYLENIRHEEVDTLLLGCTHFPLLAPIISDVMGKGVTLIDTGREAAVDCTRRLWESDALCGKREECGGSARFFVSDRPEDFAKIAGMFLGRAVAEEVRVLDIDKV